MYTYLKLKNFKSFDEVEFNFKNTETDVKKLAVIYGENGSGKTNFVKAFEFLQYSLSTLFYPGIAERMHEESRETDPLGLRSFIANFDLTRRMQEVRMLGCNENTEIEYGFKLNDIEGYYKLVFSDEVKSEKLYYIIGKNRNVHFDINLEDGAINKTLNSNIFTGKEYKKDLENEIDKFWGKNTFLSIVVKEQREKNKSFIRENVSENLLDVIDMFMQMTVMLNPSMGARIGMMQRRKNKMLVSLGRGSISIEREKRLDLCERILKDFFTQTYSEIKDVYYERTRSERMIRYKLFFKKMIANRLVDIEFANESTGTQKILNQFRAIMGALWGEFVIIDEIDSGIHDLLMKAIIESLKDEITGQLIITTHNTLLLETLNKKDIYIITTDYQGQKQVNCINDYDFKVQKNHNIRELYLKGLFGGIPSINSIDFTEIKEELNSVNEPEGGNNASK